MAEIIFMHHDKNGAREVMRHDTETFTAEHEAVRAAKAFIQWNEQNPNATTQELLHRFIDLPELSQERLGAAIEEEAKKRGIK
tara:strand:+ start:155 stop:403 length:249 start_codon:yes stop_codon:yes gene_type:complete